MFLSISIAARASFRARISATAALNTRRVLRWKQFVAIVRSGTCRHRGWRWRTGLISESEYDGEVAKRTAKNTESMKLKRYTSSGPSPPGGPVPAPLFEVCPPISCLAPRLLHTSNNVLCI